jgi:hypothetical protein
VVLAPFFCRAYFPRYINRSHRDSNLGHFFRSFDLPIFFPGLKEQASQGWCKSVIRSRAIDLHTYKPTISFSYTRRLDLYSGGTVFALRLQPVVLAISRRMLSSVSKLSHDLFIFVIHITRHYVKSRFSVFS